MYEIKMYKTRQKQNEPVRIVPILDTGIMVEDDTNFLDLREVVKIMCSDAIAIHENITEYTYLVCMNGARQITGIAELSKGNVSESRITPFDALQHAMLLNSQYVALVHNHPNRVLGASDGDIRTAKSLLKAFDEMHICLADSIIITDKNKCYSIRSNHPELWS